MPLANDARSLSTSHRPPSPLHHGPLTRLDSTDVVWFDGPLASRPPPTLKDAASWSEDFKALVASCLCKEPNERPSSADLAKHNFVIAGQEVHWAQRPLPTSTPPTRAHPLPTSKPPARLPRSSLAQALAARLGHAQRSLSQWPVARSLVQAEEKGVLKGLISAALEPLREWRGRMASNQQDEGTGTREVDVGTLTAEPAGEPGSVIIHGGEEGGGNAGTGTLRPTGTTVFKDDAAVGTTVIKGGVAGGTTDLSKVGVPAFMRQSGYSETGPIHGNFETRSVVKKPHAPPTVPSCARFHGWS